MGDQKQKNNYNCTGSPQGGMGVEESPTWGSLAQVSYIGKTSPQNGRPMEIKVERPRGGGL